MEREGAGQAGGSPAAATTTAESCCGIPGSPVKLGHHAWPGGRRSRSRTDEWSAAAGTTESCCGILRYPAPPSRSPCPRGPSAKRRPSLSSAAARHGTRTRRDLVVTDACPSRWALRLTCAWECAHLPCLSWRSGFHLRAAQAIASMPRLPLSLGHARFRPHTQRHFANTQPVGTNARLPISERDTKRE